MAYDGNCISNIARIVDACFNGMCRYDEHCTHLAKAECVGCGTQVCHGHAIEVNDCVPPDYACPDCAPDIIKEQRQYDPRDSAEAHHSEVIKSNMSGRY